MLGFDKNWNVLKRGDTIRFVEGEINITCTIKGSMLSPKGDYSVWVTTDNPFFRAIKASLVEKLPIYPRKEIKKFSL